MTGHPMLYPEPTATEAFLKDMERVVQQSIRVQRAVERAQKVRELPKPPEAVTPEQFR